jgi:hypothetical protein
MLDDIGPEIIPHLVGIPSRSPQQMLHAVGRCVSRLLGQLPTVFALDRTEEPLQIGYRATAQFRARKTRSDALGHFLQTSRPTSCQLRGDRVFRHTTTSTGISIALP